LLLESTIVIAVLVVRTRPGARWLVVCITLGIVFGVTRTLRHWH
jgi:hypothetical protein